MAGEDAASCGAPRLHLQTGSDGTDKANKSSNVKTILISYCIILHGDPKHGSHGQGRPNNQALIHDK